MNERITELFSLEGSVAVVTGALGLLGQEHCRCLAEAGAHVIAADLIEKDCAQLAHGLSTRSLGSFLDVTDPISVQALLGSVMKEFGRVDVLVNNMNEAPSLLRNDCHAGNNWIKVKCIGTKSNRSAIGARVKVVTGGHSQIEEVMSGASYISQNDLRLHFGLGRAKKVDQVAVQWPSGIKQSFRYRGEPIGCHSGRQRNCEDRTVQQGFVRARVTGLNA